MRDFGKRMVEVNGEWRIGGVKDEIEEGGYGAGRVDLETV
jgi:hypothetical protein